MRASSCSIGEAVQVGLLKLISCGPGSFHHKLFTLNPRVGDPSTTNKSKGTLSFIFCGYRHTFSTHKINGFAVRLHYSNIQNKTIITQMEHSTVLENLCRVCGKVVLTKSNKIKHPCSQYTEEFQGVFGISTDEDKPEVHPAYLSSMSASHPQGSSFWRIQAQDHSF